MKMYYTLTLKGMLSLANAKFLKAVTVSVLIFLPEHLCGMSEWTTAAEQDME